MERDSSSTRPSFSKLAAVLLLTWAQTGCDAQRVPEESSGHVATNQQPIPELSSATPQTVNSFNFVPQPSNQPKLETYTVVVDNVPVRELLFSIARDAALNLDIDNQINGYVTLNFVDQTLPAILERISELQPIRYELKGNDLRIRLDRPYIKTYQIDYLNLNRTSTSEVTVSTQISSTGQGASSGGGGEGNNNSSTSVTNDSEHLFWDSLLSNIEGIIAETHQPSAAAARPSPSLPVQPLSDPNAPGAGGAPSLSTAPQATAILESAESAPLVDSAGGGGDGDSNSNIMVNRESGILAVRATQKQHREIQGFLDEVLGRIGRQVLIEATIAEVTLSDRYQTGIDWRALQSTGTAGIDNFSNGDGINVIQDLTGGNINNAPTFFFRLTETDIGGNRLDATLRALEQFGDVKIMSSPKIMALNNQTALLKVVDNIVYFSVEVETTIADNGTTNTEFDTDINTVPVGFVMAVTPFIDELNKVTINVRPTISRIIGTVQDPNPSLADAGVVSEVPIIQVREIESILKIRSGETAIIGGLMQDDISKNTAGVPLLSNIPLIGNLFSYRDDNYTKTELVIFIRPIVVNDASLNGDLNQYRTFSRPRDAF